jgi:cell division transport system ATP-binding protein
VLVEFRSVTKDYKTGSMAVLGVNFTIEKSEFVLLVGPSGAGKTTIMKLIYMDEYPTHGEVIVGPYSSKSMTNRKIAMLRRGVGVVFQEFRLLRDLTVFENIALPLRAVGKRESEIKKRVSSVLYSVGLSSKRHQFPLKLSGGEQQRVAIARAMVLRPPLLLADEPTGNLDPDTSEQIFELLLDINRGGTSVLVATHEHNLARRLDKRILTLEGGRLVGDGGGESCTS